MKFLPIGRARIIALCRFLVLSPLLCWLTPAEAADTGRKTLTGHVPPVAANLAAFGTLPATNRLNLAIGLAPRDARGLDDFLTAVYNPASPLYRHYLTPEQFAEKFGPTAADYAAVTAFATRHHLTVTATHGNRLLLDVSGTVADIQQAFQLTLRTFHHPTEARDFYAPDAEPSVDAGLPVVDISGLNNFVRPRPRIARPRSAPGDKAAPKTGSGPQGTYQGNDFRAAYLPGVTLSGLGQSVGLFEFDGYDASDIAAYEAAAGLAAVPLQNILLDGFNGTPTTTRNSGDIEVSLDIEMAASMAPGLAKIVVFEAGPYGLQNDVLNSMAANPQVKQLSCSWGWGGGPSATTDNIFKTLAAQGQSFFTAAGDSDAFTTGASSANGVDNPSLDNAPASSPYLTVVGGTTLTTTGPGGSWSAEQVWNWGDVNGTYAGTSGGISSYYPLPSWQSGVSLDSNGGSTNNRNIPDVALTGDNIIVYYGGGIVTNVGGTSCAAPLWAALTALVNQQTALLELPPVGFLNPALYTLGQSSNYTSSFHDITTGNNFSAASPAEFSAVAGYDLCTGWGTPAGQSIIDVLAPPYSLGMAPLAGFTATGAVGGPFSQTNEVFTLTNNGPTPLPWSVISPANWLAANPAGGVLAGGATASVTVSLTAAASNLGAGTYATNLAFTNWNTGVALNVLFTLKTGQSLVENGGFETGDFTGWTLVGNTIVYESRGRSEIYNAVEPASSYPLVAHTGEYGAFLGDNELATLSQTLATAAAQSYLLSLWLDNPTSGSGQEFLVNWNGGTIFGLTNPPAFTWTNLEFIVPGAGAGTVLQFGAENVPNYFGLDDVSVTPLPALGFTSAALTPNGLNLSWFAGSGLMYQVQSNTNLAQTNWVDLGAPASTTSGVLNLLDTSAGAGSAQGFYRLLLLPP
jgi:hypothetical protein